jgi:hypothetical protein
LGTSNIFGSGVDGLTLLRLKCLRRTMVSKLNTTVLCLQEAT